VSSAGFRPCNGGLRWHSFVCFCQASLLSAARLASVPRNSDARGWLEVDRPAGHTGRGAAADRKAYQPTDPQIAVFTSPGLPFEMSGSHASDGSCSPMNWLDCAHPTDWIHHRPLARGQLNDMARANDPFCQSGQTQIYIGQEVSSVKKKNPGLSTASFSRVALISPLAPYRETAASAADRALEPQSSPS